MQFLRLRRTPKLAVPKHETDIFFVDEDGVFKKMGPDGSVAEVGSGGGGGSMPVTKATDIAGCILWLDASQIEGVADGEPVDTWADESGSGFDATATSPASANEIQDLDITGASSGQYELIDPVDGVTQTVPIAWNADAATVKAAIEALPSIGAGNTTVTLAAQVYTIEYVGALAREQVGAGTLDSNQDTLDVVPTTTETQTGFESRPAWVENVQNGKPVVRFDISKNSVATPNRQQLDFTGVGLSALAGLEGLTFFIVARGDQLAPAGGPVYFSSGDADSGIRLLISGGTFNYFLDDAGDVGGVLFTNDLGQTLFGYCYMVADAAGSGVSASRGSQNKHLVRDWTSTPAQPFADTPSVAAHLGFEEYDPIGWTGDLAEIIFYDRALNEAEQLQVAAYLAAKWNLL